MQNAVDVLKNERDREMHALQTMRGLFEGARRRPAVAKRTRGLFA